MNAIQYTESLERKELKTCSANVYEEMCQSLNCFEYIPDDVKIKPYFDIDIKPKHCECDVDDLNEYIDCWKDILEYAENIIGKWFPNAKYCIKNQSSPDYVSSLHQKRTWITSVHIIVWNYKISKKKLKSLVIEINKEVIRNFNDTTDRTIKPCDFYVFKNITPSEDEVKNNDKSYFRLFDESVYKEGVQKIRSAYADKTHYDETTNTVRAENRKSEIIFGTFEQSVITSFIPEDAIEIPDDPVTDDDDNTSVESNGVETKKPKQVFEKISNVDKSQTENVLKKLEFFMSKGFDKCCSDHDDITKIGYALATKFGKDGLDLYLKFAQSYTSWSWDKAEKEYTDKYNKTILKNNKNRCNMGTVYWIFKRYNQNLYSETSKEWNITHYKVDMIYNIEYTGAVADYFKNLYGDFICACNGIVYIYNGIRWKRCDAKNSELVRFVDKVFVKDMLEYGNVRHQKLMVQLKEATPDEAKLIDDKIKDVNAFIRSVSVYLRNNSRRTPYISDIIAFSTNNELKFDTDKYLFAFENKIYDLENACFIDPEPSLYISKSCGYDYDDNYDTNKNTDELNKVINSIFPNKDIRDYYLTYLATGLSGIHMEEFMIATGVGGNGKSLINGLMMSTIGEYGYEIPSICLTKEIKDGANPELARLDGVRFALTSEPESKKKFACSSIKAITGNDTLPVRLLHSNDVGIALICSQVCEANDVPDFDEVNQAVNRRVKATIFETIAIDKSDYEKLSEHDKTSGIYTEKNPYYKTVEFKHLLRQALFSILCEYFGKFKNNAYVLKEMPAKCKSKVVALLAASDGLYSWFEELYEKVDLETSEAIKISDIYARFSSSTYFMRLSKNDQRKLNRKNFVEKITTNLFLQKSLRYRDTYWCDVKTKKSEKQNTDYLVGWKLKPLENDVDDILDAEK
jgi:hypothetical protein